jgi:GNAT superfamily N-acetyltransferase
MAALRKMFVDALFRGDGTKTAKKLLRTLISWSENHGIKEIFLGTTQKFLAAHKFYEKNGFMKIPKSELPDTFPIMKVDSKFYQFKM